VTKLDDAKIVAVGSRSMERAAAFAERFGIDRHYGSYEELVTDAGVDVVYVATPSLTSRGRLDPRAGSRQARLVRKAVHAERRAGA
jgi:hypothetical protein